MRSLNPSHQQTVKRGCDMADDKRNREQEQGGNPGTDKQRGGRDRKPGGMEAPGSGQARREDQEDQPQE